MPHTYLNPPALFDSRRYGFSQIVKATGSATIYFSGQVAWDAGQQIAGYHLPTQTQRAFENLRRAVEAAGCVLADVVSLRIYIKAEVMDDTTCVSAALRTFFPPEALPATTWIGVARLANPAFLIEIEAVAVLP